MKYSYYICDVFTKKPFNGNQLAVFPEAVGLSDSQMQSIAREFNFSETSFGFPAEKGYTKKIRIFTPTTEVPFAGHPSIGTAFVMASQGYLNTGDKNLKIVFEEEAGLVPISINYDVDDDIFCELAAPTSLYVGKTISISSIASALSLDQSKILSTTHDPQIASVGLPFIFVEVDSNDSLKRVAIDTSHLEVILANYEVSYIHVYCRNVNGFDLKARMFAPFDGVVEDPATGSANSALIGLLSSYDSSQNSYREWTISQGSEIGRPSTLYGKTEKQKGVLTNIWIGGNSVLVSKGVFYI